MRPIAPIIQAAKNGRDILDQACPAPTGNSVLRGFFKRLMLTVVSKRLDRGDVIETTRDLPAVGVVLPTGRRDLELMPEGQRSWRWLTLYTERPIVLDPDDKIKYQGTEYRIMSSIKEGDYGVCKYFLVNDYGRK